ncbi:MAG: hypothetical protein R3Y50_01505 [Rikenellaceae bacterium]
MKKLLTLVIALITTVSIASAQTFGKGDNVLSATVGVGSDYGIPVTLGYERGVYDINSDMAIGVGGLIGFGAEKESGVSCKNFLLGAAANYHFTGVNNLDLMGGLILGINSASAKTDGVSVSDSDLLLGLNVGARYYFSDAFGVQASLGFGVSTLGLGVCYKF